MEVYILSAARTAQGSFLGSLSTVAAPRLGAAAISNCLTRADLAPELVGEVYMGNVIQAGVGQAPARQAAIYAQLPASVPCVTVNKVCGSGMQAMILATQSILLGEVQVAIAGGMENMSMAPHLLGHSRMGNKFGNMQMIDSMQHDGLCDAYSGVAMGNFAEECVKKYGFTREAQDEFAIDSFKKSQKAMGMGLFKNEIVPVVVKNRTSEIVVDQDEGPGKADFTKIPHLKPAFIKDGTVTAANASTINDGASALMLAGKEFRERAEFKIVAYAVHAQEPQWFTTAPVKAIQKCLSKANLSISQIDFFEINEAFAAVTMAAVTELRIPAEKVNIYGGAVSLGHPIGSSGSRIVVTLMNALKNNSARYGLATVCIGGGEALAVIIERIGS